MIRTRCAALVALAVAAPAAADELRTAAVTVLHNQDKFNGYVYAAGFSPDGSRVATGSYDNTARVWDAKTGQELLVGKCRGTVEAVGFSPDGGRFVTGEAGGWVRVW